MMVNFFLVNNFRILEVNEPEIRITAIPEIPGPDESAYIVIFIKIIALYLSK